MVGKGTDLLDLVQLLPEQGILLCRSCKAGVEPVLVSVRALCATVHSRSECRAAQRILQLNEHRIGDAID
jgi:hypothetical protein